MRLFVGGLSYSVSSDDLRTLFSEVGTVTDANVVIDRETRDPKGFGFVDMPTTSEAQAAISRFNGKTVDGRPLTVNEARPREERGGGGGGRRW